MRESARTIPEPLFPPLPQTEYAGRCERIQAGMESAGIDLVVLSQRENVEYVSGYISSHWFMHGFAPGIVLLPRKEEPIVIVPKFWLGTAQKKSWIQDIIAHPNTHSDPDSFPDLVVDIVRKRGWDKGTIGYELGREMTIGLPIQHFDHIRTQLGSAHWVPAGDVLWEARVTKSILEIELLQEAAIGTCRALERVRDSARIGMSELEIGHLIRQFQIEEGCEDRQFLNVRCGPDRYSMTDTLPEDRSIQEGEMLILDVGMHRQGYWSDTARCVAIGKPQALYLEVYDTILNALSAALATIHDGALASAPYLAARNVMDEADYGVHIDMMGHGIGMGMYEPPMLSPNATEALKAGMVLCVEPWITLPEEKGVLCLEEIVTVTHNGYEMLTLPNAQQLWYIE